jgi:FkbM family methyltransferase
VPWHESLSLKLRRRVQTRVNRIFHSRGYRLANYFGAQFLLGPDGIGALEISAKIQERAEIEHLIARCRDLRVDHFIDAGANIGLYTCALMAQQAVPRADLFEPNPTTLIQLRANLLINGLLGRTCVHETALGRESGTAHLVQGRPTAEYAMADDGFSRVSHTDGDYKIRIERLDEALPLVGRRLAIKMDVEGFEREVVTGMMTTLRKNHCVVQIESIDTKDDIRSMMADAGYRLTRDFDPNLVFEPIAQ